ncbi:unnamed protein product [Closterium sp. NIES-65]|nr:unnamed protein product [Closterium sp. NIES-65]
MVGAPVGRTDWLKSFLRLARNQLTMSRSAQFSFLLASQPSCRYWRVEAADRLLSATGARSAEVAAAARQLGSAAMSSLL